jgi:putative ABC transport system permease protein
MSARDLAALAIGALRGHRLRTGLSLLGVAIGVVSVVLLTSLGNGARRYVAGEFATLGTNLIIVMPGRSETSGMAPMITGAPHDLTLDDVEALRRRAPGARRLAPLATGSARAEYRGRSRDVVLIGVTADWRDVRQVAMASGQYLPSGAADRDKAVCVIGATVQRELFPGDNPLGEMLRIGDDRCLVIGIAAARGTSLGMNLDEVVQIPIVRHLRMFDRSSVSRVLIEVSSVDRIDATKAAVVSLLKERHDGEEDVTVLTQDSVMEGFNSILTVLTQALVSIAAISLGVAGLGIMNVMLVAVSERTREIGLLKALGATPAQVLSVFLAEAGLLTMLGGLAGLGVAYLAVWAARAIYPAFPVQVPLWAVVSALVLSVLVGMLFGALPARRAARLDPIVALSKR